ncbi:MAG: DUF192 domain-containing protein [Patescibacteria group bacterium]
MKWIFFICGILVILLLAALFWLKYGRIPTPLRTGQIQIDHKVIEVEIVDTILSRERGLSGRNGLEKNQGMLFIFGMAAKHRFWMKDMKIPLDMIWIKGDRIVGITEQVHPDFQKSFWQLPIYYPPEAVDKVLEVPAGTVALHSWRVGSVVQFPSSTVK